MQSVRVSVDTHRWGANALHTPPAHATPLAVPPAPKKAPRPSGHSILDDNCGRRLCFDDC